MQQTEQTPNERKRRKQNKRFPGKKFRCTSVRKTIAFRLHGLFSALAEATGARLLCFGSSTRRRTFPHQQATLVTEHAPSNAPTNEGPSTNRPTTAHLALPTTTSQTLSSLAPLCQQAERQMKLNAHVHTK
jgi:hypothetical protein